MQPSFNGHNCHDSNSDVDQEVGAKSSDYSNDNHYLWIILYNWRVFPCIKWSEAYKGWEISPVRKSVTANPLRIEWNDVLRKVLLQIVAKINAFPTTAGADRRAMTTAVEKVSSSPGESRFWSLKSSKELGDVEF